MAAGFWTTGLRSAGSSGWTGVFNYYLYWVMRPGFVSRTEGSVPGQGYWVGIGNEMPSSRIWRGLEEALRRPVAELIGQKSKFGLHRKDWGILNTLREYLRSSTLYTTPGAVQRFVYVISIWKSVHVCNMLISHCLNEYSYRWLLFQSIEAYTSTSEFSFLWEIDR